MRPENETAAQMAQKQRALNAALPVPNMEPALAYQTKEFTRRPKSGILAGPNHLGEGLRVDIPEGF